MLSLLCGFPGSGKSTVAAEWSDGIVLCPDDFRKVLSGKDFFAPIEDYVWGVVKTCARVLLAQGRHVMIDATHLTVGSRSQWIRMAQDLNERINCIWVQTPMEECKRRNAGRERQVPEEVMDRMAETFVEPTLDEGFTAITISEWKKN